MSKSLIMHTPTIMTYLFITELSRVQNHFHWLCCLYIKKKKPYPHKKIRNLTFHTRLCETTSFVCLALVYSEHRAIVPLHWCPHHRSSAGHLARRPISWRRDLNVRKHSYVVWRYKGLGQPELHGHSKASPLRLLIPVDASCLGCSIKKTRRQQTTG